MSSNCDSEGYPIDHDGTRLEDGVFSSCPPFAVRNDVLHEILSGSGKEMGGNHLDADPLDGDLKKASSKAPSAFPSSSGGIPLEDVVIVEDGYSSDDALSPRASMDRCTNSTSATIQAMMRSTKHERDELFNVRGKLISILKFLKSKGFKEEDVYKDLLLARDENGLPINHSAGKAPSSAGPSGAKNEKGQEKVEDVPAQNKTWSQVVKDATPTSPSFNLSYVPPANGESIVCPPDEILQEGNDKMKTTIVGSFTKGYVPYNKVAEFANKLWKNRGLVYVGQKDSRTFLFRFNSLAAMNLALAKGTWYIERRPLVVHAWGSTVSTVKTMPLWVRFDNIPDSYWTPQCLSRLASVIGPPLCSDELTSRMEVMPFAKICVDYTIGNDLPVAVPVTILDPLNGEKRVVEVLVSYPTKPLVCTACKSRGHLVGACPKVTRKWIRKDREVDGGSTAKDAAPDKQLPVKTDPLVGDTSVPLDTHIKESTPAKRPSSPTPHDLSNNSATPLCTFRNLKKVDEIDMKKDNAATSGISELGEFQISKSQRKKLKKQGKSPKPPSL